MTRDDLVEVLANAKVKLLHMETYDYTCETRKLISDINEMLDRINSGEDIDNTSYAVGVKA